MQKQLHAVHLTLRCRNASTSPSRVQNLEEEAELFKETNPERGLCFALHAILFIFCTRIADRQRRIASVARPEHPSRRRRRRIGRGIRTWRRPVSSSRPPIHSSPQCRRHWSSAPQKTPARTPSGQHRKLPERNERMCTYCIILQAKPAWVVGPTTC